MKKAIRVSFDVWVGEWPETRLTEEFVRNRVNELGNTILEAFDETIHNVEFKEVE